jgi:release factor glutamine methyltransferase
VSSEQALQLACAELETCADAVGLAERFLADAGIESPRFEAQLLAALALDVDRSAVIARTASAPNSHQKSMLYGLISERVRRVPLAYLRGSQEFYGLEFAVNRATLIPRPETELLVDFACEVLGAACSECAPIMVDVGAGSGCIAVAALKVCARARAVAIDLSPEALTVARQNSANIGVWDRIRFVQANFLHSLRNRVQIIVSNPPYIPSAEIAALQPEVAIHEPKLSLDGGADGLTAIRKIAFSAMALLVPGGWLGIECAQGQAIKVSELFRRSGFEVVRVVNDLAGIPRVVCGQNPTDGI